MASKPLAYFLQSSIENKWEKSFRLESQQNKALQAE